VKKRNNSGRQIFERVLGKKPAGGIRSSHGKVPKSEVSYLKTTRHIRGGREIGGAAAASGGILDESRSCRVYVMEKKRTTVFLATSKVSKTAVGVS